MLNVKSLQKKYTNKKWAYLEKKIYVITTCVTFVISQNT